MKKLVFFAVIVVVLELAAGEEFQKRISRRKRFLDPHSLSSWPDSLLRIGQEAREWGEQLSSHAERTLEDLLTGTRRFTGKIKQDFAAGPRKTPQNSQIEKEDFDPVVDVVEVPQEPVVTNPFFEKPAVYNPLFGFGFFTTWWKGPNVCVERSEVEESEDSADSASNTTDLGFSFSYESTQCVPTETSYVCTKRIHSNGVKKTMVERHQCCHGYIRRTDGRPGCRPVMKMDNLFETMIAVGATRFAHAVESVSLKEKILSGNFTIFCPTNEAMIDFEDETEENEILLDRRLERRSAPSDKASVVAGHIVDGFHNFDSMDSDQIIKSINGKSIRINKYRGLTSVFTANCVPVTTRNHFATNGLMHFVPEVLDFPTKTVLEIINTDPKFSIFKELLNKSELQENLEDPAKAWTLFIPTDSAFLEMESMILQDMREGKKCVKSTMKQHMVQSTICSSAIRTRHQVQNVLENSLLLTKDDEIIKVDGKHILHKNMLATNGVIHVIDGVLIPPQAKTILESLEEAGRKDLLDLIDSADLVDTFNQFENVTFFAPCKDAVQDISNSTKEEWQENPSKLRDILLYHVTTPKTSAFAFQNNQQLTSLLDGKPIHIKLNEGFPGVVTSATAQCARIVNSDNEACGAYVHVINKVLIPPKENIFDALETMDGYGTFHKLIQTSGLAEKLKSTGAITLLAPSDEAFDHFKESEGDEFLENTTKAEEIVKMHILPEMLCCSSISQISPFHRQYVRTEEGSLLPLHRNFHNGVRFGRARAVKCDIMAKNGIIHSVNRVLSPTKRMLFDFSLLSLF